MASLLSNDIFDNGISIFAIDDTSFNIIISSDRPMLYWKCKFGWKCKIHHFNFQNVKWTEVAEFNTWSHDNGVVYYYVKHYHRILATVLLTN